MYGQAFHVYLFHNNFCRLTEFKFCTLFFFFSEVDKDFIASLFVGGIAPQKFGTLLNVSRFKFELPFSFYNIETKL